MSELSLSELVAQLQKTQAIAVTAKQTNPELEAVKERLRSEFKTDGLPCLERLRAIGASDDFKALSDVGNLDFGELVRAGVSTDVLATLDRNRRDISMIYSGTTLLLERIPRRIHDLLPGDIERDRYGKPSVAERISTDLKSASECVREVVARLEGLTRLVSKLVSVPRQATETFRPEFPQANPSTGNPTSQVTEV